MSREGQFVFVLTLNSVLDDIPVALEEEALSQALVGDVFVDRNGIDRGDEPHVVGGHCRRVKALVPLARVSLCHVRVKFVFAELNNKLFILTLVVGNQVCSQVHFFLNS